MRHPNLVQVFDFGTDRDVTDMVMEYVRGKTLKSILTGLAAHNQRMPLEEIQRVLMAVNAGLGYAHQHGMVHHDIKPANVMVTDQGDVILTDFGIAKIVGATKVAASQAITGTPAYMSPEQGRGERGNERSDIYAPGVMLYEMVAGRVSFDASWLVTFEFDPPVRTTAAAQWVRLDGDDNIYSNAWPHCSDLDQTGLPGTHEIFDCQYAAVKKVWYSVRFDLVRASP